MKKNGFSLVEGLLLVLVVTIVGFAGWYVWSNDSGETYKIIGTENYLCTKSIPAECSGTIKVEDPNGNNMTLLVDNDTNFNGSDPSELYESDSSPLMSELVVAGDRITSVNLL